MYKTKIMKISTFLGLSLFVSTVFVSTVWKISAQDNDKKAITNILMAEARAIETGDIKR